MLLREGLEGWKGCSHLPNSLSHLIWDEKPRGAATFSEEIWLVPGLPKN